MKRLLITALAVAALAAVAAPAAVAATWRSQQPVSAGIGVPTEIGEVGDIEFRAPNRGMLITAGNGGVPAGLFAYDGTGWYRYSTVCGGHQGRIAWAGPNDFWTISDQQVGQETGAGPAQHISLCHFVDGAVVASYAEPVGVPYSYLPMNAAACNGPSDCWFGGQRLPGTVNAGAFHLHWDGSTLTAIPSLTATQPTLADPGRTVVGLAHFGGRFYEGVSVREGDMAPNEPVFQPYFIHQVSGPTAAHPFAPLAIQGGIVYDEAEEATPEQLQGFQLSAGGEALWAASGARERPAEVVVLRKAASQPFAQVHLADPGDVFRPGDEVHGLAAEPGGGAAWLAITRVGEMEGSGPAELVRVHADGSVEEPVSLPAGTEPIGLKGTAGPIACPAAEQCWTATERGWLFHLGPDLPQDTDPLLHVLVTYRPPDASLPSVPPVGLPEDNSGLASPYEREEEAAPEALPGAGERPLRRLLSHVHQRLIDGRVLELRFVLSAKARVRLVAWRRRSVVAKTPRLTMAKGPHRLRLRLNPKRWPTKLDFQAHAVARKKTA